jgi:hypothetical protein
VLASAHWAMHGPGSSPLANGENLSALYAGDGLVHAEAQLDGRRLAGTRPIGR